MVSSNPELVKVPATITIPEGKRFVKFTIQSGPLSGTKPVPVAVQVSFAGEESNLEVVVGPHRLASISLAAQKIKSGSRLPNNQVNLRDVAPPGGATIRLKSLSPYATTPATLTIPGGAMSATFTVTTSAAPEPTTAMIVAESDEARGAPLILTPSGGSLHRPSQPRKKGAEDSTVSPGP
jgi:hypothetical protein